MKITSSSIGKRLISIKDLSSTQITALCLVAGLLDLEYTNHHLYLYGAINRSLFRVYGVTEVPAECEVILAVSTNRPNYSKQLDELTSLLHTMQSLNAAGWLAAGSTFGSW